MTRQKKSRKPGTLGTKSKPKNLRERKTPDTGKAPHKAKGKPAGNRHSLETKASQKSTAKSPHNHDPRLGSKRKIPLQAPDVEASSPQPGELTAKPKQTPAAQSESASAADAIRLAEDEFARLENDPRLQDLLAQMDAGDTLSHADQAWVNDQLTRYQALADQLGIEMEDGDDDDDELEPWQKFENPKDWL